jgi:hypothetical protein
MNISVDRPKTSKLTCVELSKLPRKPHGCPKSNAAGPAYWLLTSR